MQVKFTAKNLTVSDSFRSYVAERTPKIDALGTKVSNLEIKITRREHSKTNGQQDIVELVVIEPHHVLRASATADDKFGAFDLAFGKLTEQLRRLGDNHKVHRGRHANPSTSELTAHEFAELAIVPADVDALLSQRRKHDEEAA